MRDRLDRGCDPLPAATSRGAVVAEIAARTEASTAYLALSDVNLSRLT
jgi:hypothetical protein